MTGIAVDDIISTLEHLGAMRRDPSTKKAAVVVDQAVAQRLRGIYRRGVYPDERYLLWVPYTIKF